MSDEKPKPVDDLKAGLGLLFRAAKGAVDRLPTDKIEGVVKDGAKEVGKAFETVANELDKVFTKATGSTPPAQHRHAPDAGTEAGARPADDGASSGDAGSNDGNGNANKQPFDDAYAPEPPKGPRVG